MRILATPYQDGYDAYFAGRGVNANPWPLTTQSRVSWDNGWYNGEKDDEPVMAGRSQAVELRT